MLTKRAIEGRTEDSWTGKEVSNYLIRQQREIGNAEKEDYLNGIGVAII